VSVPLEYRVIYGDTDMMGVMYHANYFRLFEAGRGEFARRHGLTYKMIEESGLLLPVLEAHMKFIRPARYDDVVVIHTWLKSRTRIRFEFGFRLTRDDQELARGSTIHVCLDRTGRPLRLPVGLEQAFPTTGEDDDQPAAS